MSDCLSAKDDVSGMSERLQPTMLDNRPHHMCWSDKEHQFILKNLCVLYETSVVVYCVNDPSGTVCLRKVMLAESPQHCINQFCTTERISCVDLTKSKGTHCNNAWKRMVMVLISVWQCVFNKLMIAASQCEIQNCTGHYVLTPSNPRTNH